MRAAYAAGVEVTQVTERAAAALSDAVPPAGHRRALRHPVHRPGRAAGRLADAAGGAGADQRPGKRGHRHPAGRRGRRGRRDRRDPVDPFTPKAVRASAGRLFHLPVVRAADPVALVGVLAGAGLSALATTGTATADLDTAGTEGSWTCPPRGCSAPRPTVCRRTWWPRRRIRTGADLRSRRVAEPGGGRGDLPYASPGAHRRAAGGHLTERETSRT